ncbi:MAG: RNA polymerase sigma factor RpoE [bacterium]
MYSKNKQKGYLVKTGSKASSASVDAELVKRVQAGDKSAYDLLVRKYQSKIINLVSRYVKDPSLAMDVSQEAFIKAYKGLPKFRGDSAFYTWLYRIAINAAKNHLVSQSRRQPDIAVDAAEAEQFSDAALLRDHDSPEHVLLSEEIREHVIEVISGLPDDLRQAITLRELDGMSYEAIANVMGCPIGTVRSRIFRARERIDQVLKPLMN